MLLSYLVRMIHCRPHCKIFNKPERAHLSPNCSRKEPLGVSLAPSFFRIKLRLWKRSICLVTPCHDALIVHRGLGRVRHPELPWKNSPVCHFAISSLGHQETSPHPTHHHHLLVRQESWVVSCPSSCTYSVGQTCSGLPRCVNLAWLCICFPGLASRARDKQNSRLLFVTGLPLEWVGVTQ